MMRAIVTLRDIHEKKYPFVETMVRNGDTPLSRLIRTSLKTRVEGRSVLDVGCGHGWVVREAQALGAHEVLGIDIDPDALLRCVGLPVECCSFDEVDFSLFDVLLCNPSQMPSSLDPTGRNTMLQPVLAKVVRELTWDGTMLLAQTELSGFDPTEEFCKAFGLECRVIAETVFNFQEAYKMTTEECCEVATVLDGRRDWVPAETRARIYEITRN